MSFRLVSVIRKMRENETKGKKKWGGRGTNRKDTL